MDREPTAPAASASRQGGRSAIPLVINKDGRRPLFHRPSTESLRADARPGIGRNAYSDGTSLTAAAAHDRRSVSPTPSMTSSNGDGPSRIPRPSSAAGAVFSKARRQISLTEAYRMAEAEEDMVSSAPRTLRISPGPVDGSPSPAPRPRPSSRLSDHDTSRRSSLYGGFKYAARADRPHRSPGGGHNPDDDTARSLDSVSSSGSFDRRLSQYADAQRSRHSPSPRLSFHGPPGKTSRIPDSARGLTKRASHGSLSSSPQPQAFAKGHVPKGWVAHLLAQEELRARSPVQERRGWGHAPDVPLPSIENQTPPQEPTPPMSRPASADAFDEPSPNKSYAWQIDQDFTAGDLQVSDSPRINTAELDRPEPSSEPVTNPRGGGGDEQFTQPRRTEMDRPRRDGREPRDLLVPEHELSGRMGSTKIDEIRRRELALAEQERASQEAAVVHRNTKLDEIREREKMFLSKRALASSKLEDIRERNSMTGSLSPEPPKPRQGPAHDDAPKGSPKRASAGEKIPNTPVTIFRGERKNEDGPADAVPAVKSPGETRSSHPTSRHVRSDSKELLRLLARATSASPVPPYDGATSAGDKPEDIEAAPPQEPPADKSRPSVGFAGIPRSPSAESVKDKRSSRAMSDNDPTDRIEGEMKLFALVDNHSERGSVRASSVGVPSDDEEEEADTQETPRPQRADAIQTPRVVGAFVETPAPAKPEEDARQEAEAEAEGLAQPHNKTGPAATARPPSDRSRSRPRSKLFVSETYDQTEATEDPAPVAFEPVPAAASTGLRRRRTRSLPRSRGPLINSVKPPSVKDDLLEIQRTYQIEDSTLDDFEKLLTDSGTASAPLGNVDLVLNRMRVKQEEAAAGVKDNSELKRYDRMSKTLNDGLMGIRTAKLGIERLEGNLVHRPPAQPAVPETMPAIKRSPSVDEKPADEKPAAKGPYPQPKASIPSRPRLGLNYPEPFRFRMLGLVMLVLGGWLVAETVMCSLYCRPVTCNPKSGPCIWEPTDPSWGSAIPVKLDQWLSGGQGVRAYEKLVEDAADAYLDVCEYLTGTSITQVNVDALDFYGKKQHRRRLQKKGLARSVERHGRWGAVGGPRVGMERKQDTEADGVDDGEEETFAADEAV